MTHFLGKNQQTFSSNEHRWTKCQ